MFTLIAVLVFKLLSCKVLIERTIVTVKSRLLCKKMANFTGKLQQSYK